MQIDQNINSYVLLQLILHFLKEKIAENHYSNQLLPSNRYLEISNESLPFLKEINANRSIYKLICVATIEIALHETENCRKSP